MARLSLTFFGTFQVTFDKAALIHFRSPKTQGLLVYLALQRERPTARELLVNRFWPEASDKVGRNNLRQSLYRLRKLLGDLDEPKLPYLLITRQTVQFNPESDFSLDVAQFLEAVDGNDLDRAVQQYQGELLPGFVCDSLEFEDWLRQEREYLHRLALEAMFEVTAGHLENGRYNEAQMIARRQLGLEPWREVAHRQLMQAFALAGERGNALAQFDNCRALLQDELGLEPARETVVLFEAIKNGRYGPIKTNEPIRPPIRIRHNLPADTTPFIGREFERDYVCNLLIQEKKRQVTIVGPGGMGKTRLALAVGACLFEAFSDGVYIVDLTPLSNIEEIRSAIGTTLDYQAPDTTQDFWPQLLSWVGSRNLLLILDNFEHLLAGATLVNDLLQVCPSLSILVTSRQRLNLVSENRFELGGLDFPETLTLGNAMT